MLTFCPLKLKNKHTSCSVMLHFVTMFNGKQEHHQTVLIHNDPAAAELQNKIVAHFNKLFHVLEAVLISNVNDIKTKAERSFDPGFVFDIEAKRTCLFQNL
jgi:hypothetical protein